eukprot:7491896-Pyramimonas_sp.AAC.1
MYDIIYNIVYENGSERSSGPGRLGRVRRRVPDGGRDGNGDRQPCGSPAASAGAAHQSGRQDGAQLPAGAAGTAGEGAGAPHSGVADARVPRSA